MLRTSSGMQSLHVDDGTRNPAALITSTPTIAFAYDYDPYGIPTLTKDSGGLGTSQNPYTFKAGIQNRVTGWVKYRQRWYSPALGRWTQQDTLDAPLDPANANRYAFAANDPINNSDPTGCYTWGDFWGGLGGDIISGVGGALVGIATKGTAAGLIGGAAAGCLGGAFAEASGNYMDGQPTSLGDVAGACGGGIVSGLLGGFGGNVLRPRLFPGA